MSERADRGVGIEGVVGPDAASELAALAENCGYGSFWINVVGAGVDPVGFLKRALERTRRIEIGVGLFPLDKYPAAELALALEASAVNDRRVILGLAGGQMKHGLLRTMADAIATLRGAVPKCRIATGGYGPGMLGVGGQLADVVLANWLTPDRLTWLMGHVETGARAAGRSTPPIYLYHRAACGEDAAEWLRLEFADYRRYPVHEKHQTAMGNPAWIGVACKHRADIDRHLVPYAGKSKIVLKPLPHQAADIEEWRSLIRFFAP
jgi:alkanesulfonate monooxygenase SsuD/methylene tetrahydromethanopterin reductase-like flavin-dependent oxidoreductase (luciferase family)